MLRIKQNVNQNSARLSPDLLQVNLTRRAKQALAMNEQVLFVEMQLNFGCMLRKKVNFSNTLPKDNFMKVTKNLYVGLETFMNGEACRINSNLKNNFLSASMLGTPRWLKIDYKQGQWSGEFGLTKNNTSMFSIEQMWLKKIISMFNRLVHKNIYNLKITQ
jgi:hypothetical protein